MVSAKQIAFLLGGAAGLGALVLLVRAAPPEKKVEISEVILE